MGEKFRRWVRNFDDESSERREQMEKQRRKREKRTEKNERDEREISGEIGEVKYIYFFACKRQCYCNCSWVKFHRGETVIRTSTKIKL